MRGFFLGNGKSQTSGPKNDRHQRRAKVARLRHEQHQAPPALPPSDDLEGLAAALKERRHFEAAGMLDAWKDRWRIVLNLTGVVSENGK